MLLKWSAVFFVIALIAAYFGFGGMSSDMAGIAKILFFVFLVVFLITSLMHLFRGRAP